MIPDARTASSIDASAVIKVKAAAFLVTLISIMLPLLYLFYKAVLSVDSKTRLIMISERSL